MMFKSKEFKKWDGVCLYDEKGELWKAGVFKGYVIKTADYDDVKLQNGAWTHDGHKYTVKKAKTIADVKKGGDELIRGFFVNYENGDKQLQGAYLQGADLKATILREAHLETAILIYSHLEKADLSYSHLEGADLFGAVDAAKAGQALACRPAEEIDHERD